MAVYDLEEQEQLDDLKSWWKQWGNTITGIILAVCVGVIGVQGWRWWTKQQADGAAVLYSAVSTATRANDTAKAKDAMAQLADKYGRTSYAPRAAMLVAATLFDAGDIAGAKAQLNTVLDSNAEDELKDIARLRLASLLFDEKQYDDALRVLDAKHGESFSGVYADLRGDILTAAGRKDDARKAYQTALAQIDAKSPYRNFVQVKLDTLGGPVAAIVTPGSEGAAAPAAKDAKAAAADAKAPAAAAPAPAAVPAPTGAAPK